MEAPLRTRESRLQNRATKSLCDRSPDAENAGGVSLGPPVAVILGEGWGFHSVQAQHVAQ